MGLRVIRKLIADSILGAFQAQETAFAERVLTEIRFHVAEIRTLPSG
jgi:hypothetical protein